MLNQPLLPNRRIDQNNFFPEAPGLRFNPSLIEWKDGYLFAYRSGWAGSEIYLVPLDNDFTPVEKPIRLSLYHDHAANYGREDPRLFYFRKQLHVSYVGVVGGHTLLHTNVLYASLNDNLTVERVYFPQYRNRNVWEKNWSFFSHQDKLHAVYSFAPHKILSIDGEKAELAYETPTPAPFSLGTEIRGGPSPALIDGEFWSFFHSRFEKQGHRIYVGGLYTFNSEPPFRVSRIIPEPIMTADPSNKPSDQYASVVWPAGAVRRKDEWTLACGIHDRWSELRTFSHSDLERKLVRVGPPKWWRMREWWADPGIFHHVVGLDEYGLQRYQFGPKDVILDIGAHIGCFAFRVRERGAVNVHCYEPFPDSFSLLKHNSSFMPGVVPFPEAVAGVKGRGRMIGPTEVNSGSGNVAFDGKGKIRIVTLDSAITKALKAGKAKKVSLLKIDAEGAEWPSLSSSKLLGKVNEIVGEWHPPGGAGELKSILEPKGFKVETSPTEDGRGLFRAIR